MKELTREWTVKAEADFHSLEREMRARKNPNFDGACFHAQQCIEKYMKARLQEAEIPFPKTHDLALLLDLTIALEPLWEIFRPGLDNLTQFAVRFRYPGKDATREVAREALTFCRKMRKIILASLDPPVI